MTVDKNIVRMYFDENITKQFAKREQNKKNFTVASIIDQAIIENITSSFQNFFAAEL